MTVLYEEDEHLLRCRVCQRPGSIVKTYVARIVGPHPDYYLRRVFLMCCHKHSQSFETFTFSLSNGIYELVVKRLDSSGNLISKEREWLVVLDDQFYEYADEEMNYLYVLYAASMLRLQS